MWRYGTAEIGVLYRLFEDSDRCPSTLVRLVGARWNQIWEELKAIVDFHKRWKGR